MDNLGWIVLIGIGIIMILSAIIFGFLSVNYYSKIKLPRILIIILYFLIALGGGLVIQIGDDIRKTIFTKEEISLLESGKSYKNFTKEDENIYFKTTMTYDRTNEKIYQKYYSQMLKWKIEREMISNKEINEERARELAIKNLKEHRDRMK